MRLPLPNFMVIGAARSGTTALYDALKQHPDIFMAERKEPVYLLFSGERPGYPDLYGQRIASAPTRDLAAYMALFAAATTQRAVGEATPLYLESADAARRIRQLVPHCKLVAILRQPAERAYSQFCSLSGYGLEPAPSLAAALDDEIRREASGWYPGSLYVRSGRYHEHLSAYYSLFPREQIRVYLYEDWQQEPRALLRDLFGFLEVAADFHPALRAVNVTRVPENSGFSAVLRRLQQEFRARDASPVDSSYRQLLLQLTAIHDAINLRPPPPLDAATRRRITDLCREDIRRLQDLIGRDLSHWL